MDEEGQKYKVAYCSDRYTFNISTADSLHYGVSDRTVWPDVCMLGDEGGGEG